MKYFIFTAYKFSNKISNKMAIASRSTSQTQIVERFADDVTNDHVVVLFQVIRLPKQVRPPRGAMPAHTRPVQTLARPHTRAPARLKPQAYVYIGLADDARSSLQSMSMGMMAGAAPISTVVLPSLCCDHRLHTKSCAYGALGRGHVLVKDFPALSFRLRCPQHLSTPPIFGST